MKRLLCAALCACLLTTQTVLAEAPQMGVNEMTRQFIADNLDSVDDVPSYQQMGREVSEALGRGEDGLLKPGTRLLRLLIAPQGDELTGNHFRMPQGDWDKLMFMFTQGLMQYELNGSLHMEPIAPLSGSLDGTMKMGAGYDSDGCLSMDGSVLGTFIDTDGSGETQGDDMYARINQTTGEQRIKLPFMDEVNAETDDAQPDVDSGAELLMSRLRQDAPHWADALDILYENMRNQPELLPLFRYWFEGGAAPGDVSMTTDQLYRALSRALNDLSADERFAGALSQTALLDAMHKDGALRIDPATMSAMQRKFAVMGFMVVAASELNRQDKTGWPSGALDIKGGNATLSLTIGQDRYGDFVAKLDATFSRSGDGASLRATLIDESGYITGDRGTHTARLDCAEGEHTLLYYFVDNYGSDGRYLWLDVGHDGLQIEFSGDNNNGPYANLHILRQGEAGGYSVQGQIGSHTHVAARLEGGGTIEGGVAKGEIALDYFEYADSEASRMASVSYSVGGGQFQLSGYFTNGQMAPLTMVLGFDLSGTKTDDKFDLRASYDYAYGPEPSASLRGHRLRIDGARRKTKWTGNVRVTPMIGDKAQKDIVNGEYALTTREDGGELSAKLTATQGSTKIPVRVNASRGARSLSLLVGAMQDYKFALDANLDPDDLLLSYGVSVGALLSELKLYSHADGERRQSAYQVTANGEIVQRVELDSLVSPIADGYAFEHRFSIQPAPDSVASASVTGEATAVLDMQSGSPLVMRQAASFAIEVEDVAVTGEFKLNHRFFVDERKHRAPKQPQRIEQRFAPEPTPEPEPDPEIEEEPEDDEEEYGYPVEPVDDGESSPPATKRPRNTPSPLVPEATEEPSGDDKTLGDPIDEYEDIYDAAHYAYSDDGETMRIASYFGENIDLYVPMELEGKPVGAIGESAFENNEKIQSAFLPETITAIGAAAFSGCTGLVWVYIPPNCADIADDAFEGCEATMVIVGSTGSPAQAFAEAHDIYFASMDEPTEDESVEDVPADEVEIEHQAELQVEQSEEEVSHASETGAPAEDDLLVIEPEIITG